MFILLRRPPPPFRIRSGEVLQVETGSLYPALHRLERQGWVRSEWKQTESNQRAKFYRVTAAGKKQLATDHGRWRLLARRKRDLDEELAPSATAPRVTRLQPKQ